MPLEGPREPACLETSAPRVPGFRQQQNVEDMSRVVKDGGPVSLPNSASFAGLMGWPIRHPPNHLQGNKQGIVSMPLRRIAFQNLPRGERMMFRSSTPTECLASHHPVDCLSRQEFFRSVSHLLTTVFRTNRGAQCVECTNHKESSSSGFEAIAWAGTAC